MAQYISKSALVAEIERIMDEQQEICKADVALGKAPDSKNIEVIYQFQQFTKFLDTLEVKEVDFEKEIANQYESNYEDYLTYEEFADIAKHFFELGMLVSNKA